MIRVPLEHLSAAQVGPRCLVTGAGGYVGSHLIPQLTALGCTVIAADLVAPEGEAGVDPLAMDITDRDAVMAHIREHGALTLACLIRDSPIRANAAGVEVTAP